MPREEVCRKSEFEPQPRAVDLCTEHPAKTLVHAQNETGSRLILRLACELCSLCSTIGNLIFFVSTLSSDLLRDKGWHASYSAISLCSSLHSFPQSRNFQETNVEGGEGAISKRQWESQMDWADFAVCSTNHRVISPFCHQCLDRKTPLD